MQATTEAKRGKQTFRLPEEDFRLEFPDPFFYVLKTMGRKFTDRQLHAVDAANEDLRIGMNADGDFEIMPPPFPETSRMNMDINAQLWIWARKNKSGVVFESSAKFTLPNGAKRMPDAAWILTDRYYSFSEIERAKSFTRVAPDVVIELGSASDRLPILRKKMEEYIENGVRLAWLIDPIEKLVHI